MDPHVILVDEYDQQIGIASKLLAHEKGLLHRAFSIFILRVKNGSYELLLQKRQQSKYHCGGLWTNTCCSHPAPGESTIQAARKRLQCEMGFTTSLKEIGNFTYKANFDNGLIEYEYDHVLLGHMQLDCLMVNAEEVMDYRWMPLAKVQAHCERNPTSYTPWFSQATALLFSYLSHLEDDYLSA